MQVSYNKNRLNAGGNINTTFTISHYHGTNWKARGEYYHHHEDQPRLRMHRYPSGKFSSWRFPQLGRKVRSAQMSPRYQDSHSHQNHELGRTRSGFIKWLYGPAGAGKSAIAQTIAEMCHARHLLLASFFFSRTDPKRNNEKFLIASIACQIALNAPVTRRAIEAAVDKDPAIFQCSIEAQLTTLIINPLTELSKTGTFRSNPIPNLIIIDGLDECNDHRVQQHILHTFSIALQQPNVPLKFLICSRKEPHLTHEFTSMRSEGMATCLSLEDGYERNADIERYLRDSFHKIARTHPLKEYIPSTWPTDNVLSTLVDKSSGQFIFAATVVKYISSNRHLPTRRLEIILGMQPSPNDRPFTELDTLYMGILSSVEDVRVTLRLLGVLILCDLPAKSPQMVGEFMFLDPGEVERLLLDLVSVVECVDMNTEIRMLHASFPDFLFDRSRSGEYYIDASMMHAEIAKLCLSHIEVPESEDCGSRSETLDYALRYIIRHLSEAEPSADLREALLNTCCITVLIKLEPSVYRMPDLLAHFLFFLNGSVSIVVFIPSVLPD